MAGGLPDIGAEESLGQTVRISQVTIEVLRDGSAGSDISQVCLETMRSYPTYSPTSPRKPYRRNWLW